MIQMEKNRYTKVSTLSHYIKMSVNKAWRVNDKIHGCSYYETLMILELMGINLYVRFYGN